MQKITLKLVFTACLCAQTLVSYSQESNLPKVSFRAAIHQYLEKEPRDPFTLIKAELESEKLSYDPQKPLSYLESLLSKLKVSKHSQQLVFSTTSLQLSRISPRNPRAIYFNEDLYLGYVPGGQNRGYRNRSSNWSNSLHFLFTDGQRQILASKRDPFP